jgi:hypothetical protein
MTFRESVRAMNRLVIPCPRKGRVLGFLWRRRRHNFEDYTHALNTSTHTTLDRCKDCGFLVLGSD